MRTTANLSARLTPELGKALDDIRAGKPPRYPLVEELLRAGLRALYPEAYPADLPDLKLPTRPTKE